MQKLVFVILFLFGFIIHGQNILKPINHTSDKTEYIGKNIYYLIDENHEYSVEEVWQKLKDNKFLKNDDKVFARPASSKAYWFAFAMSPITDYDIWIDLHNCSLDSIEFYKLNQNGELLNSVFTGMFLPTSTRVLNYYTFWFPLNTINDKDVCYYLIKCHSKGMMEVPMIIANFENLTTYRVNSNYLAIFFIGALTLMIFYNLFLFVFTRDSIYFYYTMYIFFILFNTTFLNNFPIIDELFGVLAHEYAVVWITPGFVFIGFFTMKYFSLKRNLLISYRAIQIQIILLVCIGITQIIESSLNLTNIYQLVTGTYLLTCLITGYVCWYKKVPNARLYAIGWTIMVLMSIVYALVVNGALTYNMIIRNIMYFGIMIEITIFSIALAKRINSLRLNQETLNQELIQKNKALLMNNEALDSFTYHVSHDLKTVLSNSYSMATLANKYQTKNEEKLSQVIERLLRITKEGMETVQGFLDIGKTESLLMNEDLSTFSVKKEIVSILFSNNLSNRIKVNIVDLQKVKIEFHKKAFQSIVLNLVTNSIKYNNNEPEAIIDIKSISGIVTIIYKDNGIGIDLSNHGDILFEPFKRVSDTSLVEGTGLGLFLVKKIITKYNGTITAHSELGKGLEFTIQFPI